MSDKAKNSNDNLQLLMAAATFAIGEEITSSVLLVLFRMIQGFCRRKINGTTVLFMEYDKKLLGHSLHRNYF